MYTELCNLSLNWDFSKFEANNIHFSLGIIEYLIK